MQTTSPRADTKGMPGTLHQGILALLQEDPWLAFDILGIRRPVDGVPVASRAEIERDGKAALTLRQGYPDLVLVHRGATARQGVVITIEAQKDYDAEKRWIIPVYQANLAEEHRLETWVVVVSLDVQMSRSLRLWREGGPPRVDALLLDIESVLKSPWLDDPARRPMAAVLAGALHGYAGDFEAARRAFLFTRTMSGKRRQRHGMTILAALEKHERDQLIGELPMQEQHDWMDVERRSGTYHFGVEEGLQQGREQGREQGLEQGLEQGREQGRMALVGLIFDLLAERGVAVDGEAEAQIRSCEDLTTLQRWAHRAVHATSSDELLER
jgi:hypothetical protein